MPAVRTPLAVTIVGLCLCFLSGPAWAQDAQDVEPLVTDRPDTTESAEVVGRGRFQLEAGYSFLSQPERESHQFGEVLGRWGLGDAVELRIGLNSFVWQFLPGGNGTGLRDFSLGAKVKLARGNGGSSPDLAMIVSTSLPTGSLDTSANSLQPAALLAAAWTLSESVSLGVNAGYGNLEGDGRRLDEFNASVAFGFSLDDRWGAFVEYFGVYPGQSDGITVSGLDTGLTWLWTPDLQLDTRVGYEFAGAQDTFFIGLGVSSRW